MKHILSSCHAIVRAFHIGPVGSLILVGLLVWHPAFGPQARAQTDNFDDGNDLGWAHNDPLGGLGAGPRMTWSFPAGAYRLQAAVSPDPVNAGPARGASLRQDVVYTDFYVAVDLVDWNDSLDQAIGILARIQPGPGLGVTSGYALTYQPANDDIQISRVDNENATQANPTTTSAMNVVMDVGDTYRLVFKGKGPNLEGRVYHEPDFTNPIATVTAQDLTYASGTCGLVVFDNTGGGTGIADATYDNYLAQADESPKLHFAYSAGSDFSVSWSTNATGFTLEWTDHFGGVVVWQPITSGISTSGSEFVYSEPAVAAAKFFRLRK